MYQQAERREGTVTGCMLSLEPCDTQPPGPLAWDLRFDDVPQSVVFFVDGEQASIGHLSVLVNGDFLLTLEEQERLEGRRSVHPSDALCLRDSNPQPPSPPWHLFFRISVVVP